MTDVGVAEILVRAEYARLCNALSIIPVALEIYVHEPDAPRDALTLFGAHLASGDAMYSGTKRVLILPIGTGDDLPRTLPEFPPTNWDKQQWSAWRIDLWHEVAHQVSNDVTHSWFPNEPGRTRGDGSRSAKGHGEGWARALDTVAGIFQTSAETLDRLLDR